MNIIFDMFIFTQLLYMVNLGQSLHTLGLLGDYMPLLSLKQHSVSHLGSVVIQE